MPGSQLPIFKPSGLGSGVDLKNIITSQIIAWGGFKGRFSTQYEDLAETFFIDGVEVYKEFPIHLGINNPDSKEYSFMKLIGFSDEDISEINTTYRDNTDSIKSIDFAWSNIMGQEETDWDFWMEVLSKEFKNITEIRIGQSVDYNLNKYPNESQRPPRRLSSYGINYLTEDNTYYRPPQYGNEQVTVEPERLVILDSNILSPNPSDVSMIIPNPQRISNNTSVELFRGGENVTHKYSYSFLRMMEALVLLEPELVPRKQEWTSRENWEYEALDEMESEIMLPMQKVYHTEVFEMVGFDIDKWKAKYLNYVIRNSDLYPDIDMTEEESDEMKMRIAFSRWFWLNVDEDGEGKLYEVSNGLFMQSKESFDYNSGLVWGDEDESIDNPDYGYPALEWDGQIVSSTVAYKTYITVEGIRTSTQGMFGYLVSELLDLRVTRQDKRNWLQKFVGGLIKAFLSFIDAIINVALKIPILKQTTEILLAGIASVFNVSFEGAKDILGQVILAVTIIAISFFMPSISGTALSASPSSVAIGLNASLSAIAQYASWGNSLYSAVQRGQYSDSQREINKNRQDMADERYVYERDNMQDPVAQAFMGTMGSYEMNRQADKMMFEQMFDLFATLELGPMPKEFNK